MFHCCFLHLPKICLWNYDRIVLLLNNIAGCIWRAGLLPLEETWRISPVKLTYLYIHKQYMCIYCTYKWGIETYNQTYKQVLSMIYKQILTINITRRTSSHERLCWLVFFFLPLNKSLTISYWHLPKQPNRKQQPNTAIARLKMWMKSLCTLPQQQCFSQSVKDNLLELEIFL